MYIGIDLGGTNIAAGLVTEDGQLLQTLQLPTGTHRGRDAIVRDMCSMCRQLAADSEAQGYGRPKAVGIGVPCVVDRAFASIHVTANLGEGWVNVPLKAIMEADLGIPVFLDNDGNLAGLAEFVSGSLKGVDNGILLTLGTGIGGGFILGGKLFRGSHGAGPEVGHIVLGENFFDCNCGQNGCFETFASATGIIRHAEKLIQEGQFPESVLHQQSKERPVNAQMVFDAAKAEDPLGNCAVERMTDYLALGISNLVNLLDPDVVALGGGVANAGEFLLKKTEAKFRKTLLSPDVATAQLVFAQLGNDAGIIGAGLLGKMMIEA